MAVPITIETAGSQDMGFCECCGQASRRVWGYAYEGERCVAAYFVFWTLGHVRDFGAQFDLIIGDWGDGVGPDRRSALAMDYRVRDDGRWFMIVDAKGRAAAMSSLVSSAWSRQDALGTPIATQAFSIVDAICLQDARIADVLG